MTSGPRRIRVVCAKCDYNKVRTLEAGDDRTLTQLSASLRCGGCRTWGKNGAVSVTFADFETQRHPRPARGPAEASDGAVHTASADEARKAKLQPRHVHGVCLDCGHNENFRPKWRRGDTLESLARESMCPACGAEGAAGNIHLRAARPKRRRRENRLLRWDVLGSVAATLAWPLEMLGLLILIPLRFVGRGIWLFLKSLGRELKDLWEPLLKTGAVAAIAAGALGVGYLACILIGFALSAPAELVFGAVEHEHRDNFRNSPKGGYYVRLEAQAETPRQMTYYNRRTIGDD